MNPLIVTKRERVVIKNRKSVFDGMTGVIIRDKGSINPCRWEVKFDKYDDSCGFRGIELSPCDYKSPLTPRVAGVRPRTKKDYALREPLTRKESLHYLFWKIIKAITPAYTPRTLFLTRLKSRPKA